LCPHVYFQPGPTTTMEYPAIVYRRDPADTKYANNKPYRVTKHYEVTLIARSPDEDIWQGLAGFESATHDRFFVNDELNHDVFSIYY
jgi:hypothetical protein